MKPDTAKNNNSIIIKKASGDTEIFYASKLKHSLQRAGAEEDTIAKIVSDVEKWIYRGVSTKRIYAKAFSLLRKYKSVSAMRYRLKGAILELGSTGYPFEILIGELFKKMGYKTEVGVVCQGMHVKHEMDVIASNNNIQHLVECKYHKDQGKHVSVQVPLYVRSRVNDIIDYQSTLPEYNGMEYFGWVVTNTRFTPDSTGYGNGSGLKLLSWDYPYNNGLKELLEKHKLYPVTILKTLISRNKQYLLEKGVVTCEQLNNNMNILQELKLSKVKTKRLMQELNELMY